MLTALLPAAASILGYRGILAICWLCAMALDYVSGTLAAMKQGNWSSKLAREGLWHKAGMIFAVTVAGLSDVIMALVLKYLPEAEVHWPGLTLPLVLSWYILTELGSILENAMALGAPVPRSLLRVLRAGKAALNSDRRELP